VDAHSPRRTVLITADDQWCRWFCRETRGQSHATHGPRRSRAAAQSMYLAGTGCEPASRRDG